MPETSIYDEIGIPTVVNAAGTKTRISGSLMRPEAANAMCNASERFVQISDLQARASELIAEVTGAEAGYVSNGASGGMTLCAAACIAGSDVAKMDQLPKTNEMASDIVMPRSHRNGYDHAFRVAGADIVDVGGNDQHLGTGGENTELWEIDTAINEETVAVAYMEKSYTRPPLEDVVDVAHENDVPVIVDAAAELPPVENLSRFVEKGADLVVFSGGKAIRGPQSTGIIAGKSEYIQSIALQNLDMHTDFDVWSPPSELIDWESLPGVPRHGLGRGLKVGKEEIVGLIVALEEFIEIDHDAEQEHWRTQAEWIANELRQTDAFGVRLEEGGATNRAATVFVTLSSDVSIDVAELVRSLRAEDPRIFVGSDHLESDEFTINPMCLTEEEVTYLVDRLKSYVD